jgi:hypothetical protein
MHLKIETRFSYACNKHFDIAQITTFQLRISIISTVHLRQ